MRINDAAFHAVFLAYAKEHRLFQQSVLRELLLTVLHANDRDRTKKGRYARAIKATLKSFDLEGELKDVYRQALFAYGREVQKITRTRKQHSQTLTSERQQARKADIFSLPVGTQLALDV